MISYEGDKHFFNGVKNFNTGDHSIYFADDWDKIDIDDWHWGVAFIDHGPAHRRSIEAARLANIADYVVIHDSDTFLDREYHYSEMYHLFKYRYNYRRQRPYTTVLSNFFDLRELSD